MTNAELLAALKPPPDFCFLWIDHWSTCMTKSEWSGWAQAFGAVLAIMGAIAVAWWQENARALESKQLAIIQVRNAAGTLDAVVEAAAEDRSRKVDSIQAWLALAEQAVNDFRVVPVEKLSLQWNVAVIALRSLALQVDLALRASLRDTTVNASAYAVVSQERGDELVGKIGDLQKKVAPHMAVIREDHPGITMPKWFQPESPKAG